MMFDFGIRWLRPKFRNRAELWWTCGCSTTWGRAGHAPVTIDEWFHHCGHVCRAHRAMMDEQWRGKSHRDQRPYASRVALGPGKYYWAVWPGFPWGSDGPLPRLGEGIVSSEAEAEAAILAFAPDAHWMAAYYARSVHRAKAHARRRTRPGPATGDPGRHEYVWSRGMRYRIDRRTPKFIFVVIEETRGWGDYPAQRVRLDRQRLERGERVWSQEFRGAFFLHEPAPEVESKVATPECLLVLGLTWPSTRAQIARAFRRAAKGAHPDHGGNADDFRRLQATYEQALAFACDQKREPEEEEWTRF